MNLTDFPNLYKCFKVNNLFMKKVLDQFIKFYIIGAIGLVVNLGILFLLTNYLKLFYMISSGIGFAISVTTNYIGNKIWTFRDKNNDRRHVAVQYVNFWLVSAFGGVIQLSLLYLLVEKFGVWYVLAGFISIAVASFSNFILNKLWTFRNK